MFKRHLRTHLRAGATAVEEHSIDGLARVARGQMRGFDEVAEAPLGRLRLLPGERSSRSRWWVVLPGATTARLAEPDLDQTRDVRRHE